jgi:hypothetical protein
MTEVLGKKSSVDGLFLLLVVTHQFYGCALIATLSRHGGELNNLCQLRVEWSECNRLKEKRFLFVTTYPDSVSNGDRSYTQKGEITACSNGRRAGVGTLHWQDGLE